MNEQNNHAALTIAQQYPPAQYNLLVPMQTVTEIADIQKPVMNSVSISTNLNDGEIYEMEKAKDEWRDSKGYVHKATPAKYALTKKGTRSESASRSSPARTSPSSPIRKLRWMM